MKETQRLRLNKCCSLDLRTQQVERVGGIESRTDVSTRPCVKQVAGGKCSLGSFAGALREPRWVGCGGVWEEVQEGGDTCIHIPGDLVVKNPPASAGDRGSIPDSRRSPGEGNGNPLQYSYLENPMDKEARHATVYGVAKSRT